jgi:DNA-binding NarL/FixJ family response regulator
MVSVAVVEDDEKIRKDLVVLLEWTKEFSCAGAYATAEDAIKDIPTKHPKIVLMDIKLPRMDGIQCTQKLKTLMPEVQVVMWTVMEDANIVFQALQAGAIGYLLKMSSPEEILAGLRQVSAGGSPMSTQIARKVIQAFQQKHEITAKSEATLTAREVQILDLLAKGHLYKEIAAELSIAIPTIHNHIRNIYEKLQVHTRTEAVMKYLFR